MSDTIIEIFYGGGEQAEHAGRADTIHFVGALHLDWEPSPPMRAPRRPACKLLPRETPAAELPGMPAPTPTDRDTLLFGERRFTVRNWRPAECAGWRAADMAMADAVDLATYAVQRGYELLGAMPEIGPFAKIGDGE